MKPNFSGWATKVGLKCSDGRTIMKDAFAHNDKMRVPLVWQHQHNEPTNVLGYAILEHRDEGVYAYGFFNDSEYGTMAKTLVEHGDVNQMSIYANQLQESGNKEVTHGNIREVSLVLAGANPGAVIENVALAHGDGTEFDMEEAVITTGVLFHAEGADEGGSDDDGDGEEGETVQDVLDSMTDAQKDVVYYLVGEAAAAKSGDGENASEGGSTAAQSGTENGPDDKTLEHKENNMGNSTQTRNIFDQFGAKDKEGNSVELTHSDIRGIIAQGEKLGSLKEAVLAHAAQYGITNIETLFPDAKLLTEQPELIGRKVEWVDSVISGTRKVPFSRIKTMSADITHEEARAKGYVKASLKKEEFFALKSRSTGPTTIYKKQKLDRDDIIDITSFDIVAWIKAEMRLMFDEELARAILLGDGRAVDHEDKVKDPSGIGDGNGIRSIAHEHDFYAHRVTIPTNTSPKQFITEVVRARKHYRGAGNPTLYITEDLLTDLLLIEDGFGRALYETEAQLSARLRVSKIVAVEQMEGVSTAEGDLQAILVNIADYSVGTDAGGNLSFFDDFDIDYNQFKYLLESRVSGALTKYKSALVISRVHGTVATPTAPTFVANTGVVTIPTVTGVEYFDAADDTTKLTSGAMPALDGGDSIDIVAKPAADHYFPSGVTTTWHFLSTKP